MELHEMMLNDIKGWQGIIVLKMNSTNTKNQKKLLSPQQVVFHKVADYKL